MGRINKDVETGPTGAPLTPFEQHLRRGLSPPKKGRVALVPASPESAEDEATHALSDSEDPRAEPGALS